MDIDYLLALQETRNALPAFVADAFNAISFVGEGPLLVALALVIYWCFDKRVGLFAGMCMMAGNFVVQVMKGFACVYRPWIRDARIIPSPGAVPGATGYSFPSGHTAGSATVLGSIAWLERKRHKVASALCVVFVLLVAFSRNFLGVHTPQDVIAGLLIAVIMIALTQLLFSWIERGDREHPGNNRDIVACCIAWIICIAAIVALSIKPYPLDYVDGMLLVDPAVMIKGAFEAVGLYAGTMLGWVLERRFVGFETAGLSGKTRLVRAIVGIAMAVVLFLGTDLLFKLVMPYHLAKLFSMFVLAVSAFFLTPLAFGALERAKG